MILPEPRYIEYHTKPCKSCGLSRVSKNGKCVKCGAVRKVSKYNDYSPRIKNK